MKLFLTSHIGGSIKENGRWIPDKLFAYNGFLDMISKYWISDSKVLIIGASPDDYDKNDSILSCFKEAFPMSGLSISSMDLCDDRNIDIVKQIKTMDAVLLSGGHVPTENEFFKRIGLRDLLSEYEGMVIAWSAGSMNCAENVYAGPELEGEAIDPDYKRWITGLGLTDINIFPHYQSLKDEWLDGYRLIEDITFKDSIGHEIIALNDGSYIFSENGIQTLYGEAYRIKDEKIEQICNDDGSIEIL